MTRLMLAFAVSLAFAVAAARAADLPTGTWAVNVDDNKGDLIVKEVKDGKVSGVLIDTDFTGTWNGKELRFVSGAYTFEAQLVREPGEKGLTKYTLTGTRSKVLNLNDRAATGVHVVKAGGWYAQLSAEAPMLGEIKAEVRGVLVVEGTTAYVSVRRKTDTELEETRVYVNATADEWKQLAQTLAPLNGKEVVVTAALGQSKFKGKDGGGTVPSRAMYFLGKFDIKLAK